MQNVHFLNIEYLATRTVDFIAGLSFPVEAVPAWVATFVQSVLFLGMALSFILLILVVYAQLRMVQVEHEGFHALEEEEHEALAHAHGPEGETHTHSRWDDIVEMSSSGSESDRRRAILEADIMLGDALNEKGFTGPTVADQLRSANPIQMTTLDLAWSAHKLRNRIAHDGEALELSERDVRTAIDQYRRALEELGAI